MSECAPRCPSCVACRPGGAPADEAAVLAQLAEVRGDVVLGGGDATRWPPLRSVLEGLRARDELRAWVEAPAAAFTAGSVVRDLAAWGARGVVVMIEALGEPMRRALRVGDGEEAVRLAEEAGLATQARLLLRPKTFAIAAPLARKLAPRNVWLEIVRRDWGKDEVPMPVD
ncbi:MAG: hypothetical protein HYV09_21130, partial [Deltaproteobacteria bacterium]|nr:hypothetical protein [Deltaproteobacteria bacterium]